MSVEAMVAVAHLPFDAVEGSRRVSGFKTYRVLLVLAEHADENGDNAHPSQKTIGEEAGGLSSGDVNDALKALRSLGLIAKTAEAIPRKRGATYSLPFVRDSLGESPTESDRDSLGEFARGTHSGDSLGEFTRGTRSGNPRTEPDPDPDPDPEPDDDAHAREIVHVDAIETHEGRRRGMDEQLIEFAVALAEQNSDKKPWSDKYRAGVASRVRARVEAMTADEIEAASQGDAGVLAKAAGVTLTMDQRNKIALRRRAARAGAADHESANGSPEARFVRGRTRDQVSVELQSLGWDGDALREELDRLWAVAQ